VTQQVEIAGAGLHTGREVRVALERRPGPFRLASPGAEATREDLVVVSTARATTVASRDGKLRVGTVEHALAAFAGLGVHSGVTMRVDGPELPLLDGGASAWCEALARLDVRREGPRLRVARDAVLDVGPSRFELRTGGAGVEVSVRLDVDDARIAPDAAWHGDARDFVERIAPARTFTLARDVEELLRRGLARHVPPASVVVLAPDAIHHAGRPFAADEPARHKLLDLVGDLYLVGGPPLGRVHALRPGHASNARALRRALDEGILVPV
jgi:UDP-3-O-[3-hydroxymyristoyl] N-acetylglucosamine deacetylase